MHALASELSSDSTLAGRALARLPYLRLSRRARAILRSPEATIEGTSITSAGYVRYCLARHRISHAQMLQDLLVLFLLGEDHRGYAVEFGAADGVTGSNSYLLEQRGWDALVAEPARGAQDSIRRHRRGQLDFRCVWARSGEQLEFVEAANAQLSTIAGYLDRDHHAAERTAAGNAHYLVETVSLRDLLRSHQAPQTIDYLSVDTEGSEFEILSHFDFDEYAIKIITVEHNAVAEDRARIHDLLSTNGFARIFDHLARIEDWYVHRDVLAAIQRTAHNPAAVSSS